MGNKNNGNKLNPVDKEKKHTFVDIICSKCVGEWIIE